MMRLTKLSMRGLKAADRDLSFAPVTVLIGENGASKTAVLQAVHLLARGSAPGMSATSEGILRLMRGKEIEVSGTFEVGQASRSVRRAWTLGKKGVTQTISGDLLSSDLNTQHAAGALMLSLGGWAEAWAPDDLLRLSPDKLRRRLVSLVQGSGDNDTGQTKLADIPQWAQPRQDEPADEWAMRVSRLAKDRLNEARTEVRRLEGAAEETGWSAVRDPAPVKARLASLREEDAKRLAVAERDRRAESLSVAITGMRSALEVVVDVETATASFDAAQRALEAVSTTGPSEARTKAQDRIDEAKERVARLMGRIDVMRGASRADAEFTHCAGCGADLKAQFAIKLRAAELDLAAATAEIDAATKERRAHQDVIDAATGPLKDAVRQAAHALAAAKRRATAEHEIGRREIELEILLAETDELRAGLRSSEDIRSDISRAEAELVEIGIHTERREAWLCAKDGIETAQRDLETAKHWVEVFANLETAILADIRTRLEEPVSAWLKCPVKVELESATGARGCRFVADGVDALALSGGESLVFQVGLLAALGARSRAEWRVLPIDCFERVSLDRRESFLRALVDAVERRAIDQAIVCGCPDSVPDVSGVKVIRLGVERRDEATHAA